MPRVRMGEEGRGTPRKAPGSRVAGRDPGVTEWGNPPAERAGTASPGGRTGQNRGTETSQYPGRESDSETRSSGERTGFSPNDPSTQRLVAGADRVGGHTAGDHQRIPRAHVAAGQNGWNAVPQRVRAPSVRRPCGRAA